MTSAEKKPEIGQWVYAFDAEFENAGVPLGSVGKVISVDFPPGTTEGGGRTAEGWTVAVAFYLRNKKTGPIFIEQMKYERYLEEIEASNPGSLNRSK